MPTKRLSTIQQYDGIEPGSQQDDLSHVLIVACARHEAGVLKLDDRNRVTETSDGNPTDPYWETQKCDICGAFLSLQPNDWIGI